MSEALSSGCFTVLTELAEGERARVEQRTVGPLEAELLAALGLREGSELRVCRAGDPCIVEVRSARIGMTRRVAEQLAVRRVGFERQ